MKVHELPKDAIFKFDNHDWWAALDEAAGRSIIVGINTGWSGLADTFKDKEVTQVLEMPKTPKELLEFVEMFSIKRHCWRCEE